MLSPLTQKFSMKLLIYIVDCYMTFGMTPDLTEMILRYQINIANFQ